MGGLLMAMGLPTLIFGILALLAMRFGAESRPYFDERPVHDDRPNWFPIVRSVSTAEELDEPEPSGGEPVTADQPPRRAATSARSAATRPSGVWSAASTSGS
jgi:hypothetical protein